MLDFATAEEKFYALMGRLAAGVITQDEFRARLEELIVRDDAGQTWMIGAQSGRWYRYDGKRWVQDTPPRLVSPTAGTQITAPPPTPVSETDLHPLAEERCPRCDHVLIAGATFCDRCGLRLPGDTAVYPTADKVMPTEPCPQCGRPLPVEAPFCAGCGYRRPKKAAPPPPRLAKEPFAVPPPPPPPPVAVGPARQPWLNWLVVGAVGLVILCCLVTVALALFWPTSPISLMRLTGPLASPTAEPTQTVTLIIATATPPLPTVLAPPTATATEPPPTRVRTPTVPPFTPPPLPTVTQAPTRPAASPTSAVLRFRLKDKRLVEEKLGLGILEVVVVGRDGRGIAGVRIQLDGGDPATWKEILTTDDKGRCGHYALSPNLYNVTLIDYGVVELGVDCRNKHWEVIFEAY